jgi:hypothetical protein
LKKCKKKENTWKIKKQNFKTEKNRKQNKWGKQRQKGGKIGINGLVHLHFLCIYFAFSICVFFCFALFWQK